MDDPDHGTLQLQTINGCTEFQDCEFSVLKHQLYDDYYPIEDWFDCELVPKQTEMIEGQTSVDTYNYLISGQP